MFRVEVLCSINPKPNHNTNPHSNGVHDYSSVSQNQNNLFGGLGLGLGLLKIAGRVHRS